MSDEEKRIVKYYAGLTILGFGILLLMGIIISLSANGTLTQIYQALDCLNR